MPFGPHVGRSFAAPRAGDAGGRPSLLRHIRVARAEAAAAGFDARAFQVFVAGPRSLALTLRDAEADELRAYLAARPDVQVVAHGTYLDAPWGGAPGAVRAELAACARAGIGGLVLHLGRPPPAAVARRLPALLAAGPPGVALYLEVPAVKPAHAHYETPEKLAALFRAVRAAADPALCRTGLCVDTAHLWSCGVDLGSYEAADAWVRRLEAVADVIPPGRVILHLNDSRSARGSGTDRHAPLLGGLIWGAYADCPRRSGLAAFVDYATRNDTVVILERKADAESGPTPLLDDYAALARLTAEVRLA